MHENNPKCININCSQRQYILLTSPRAISGAHKTKKRRRTKIQWRIDDGKNDSFRNTISENAAIRKLKTSLVTSISFIYEKKKHASIYAMRALLANIPRKNIRLLHAAFDFFIILFATKFSIHEKY